MDFIIKENAVLTVFNPDQTAIKLFCHCTAARGCFVKLHFLFMRFQNELLLSVIYELDACQIFANLSVWLGVYWSHWKPFNCLPLRVNMFQCVNVSVNEYPMQ